MTEVILRFGEGRLPNVPDNTSLRVLLSTVLNCSPMRITKKFSGRNALPRGRYRRTAAPEPAAVWKSNFGRPTPSTRRAFRSCVCAMAWRFHAIDATLSPWPRRLDGVEAHEGPRNISQDNLTHWLISTQARGPRAAPDARARVPPARPGRRREADDEPLRHVRPAHAAVPRRRHHHGAGACVEINQCRSPATAKRSRHRARGREDDANLRPSADADRRSPTVPLVLRRPRPWTLMARSRRPTSAGPGLRRGLPTPGPAGAAGAAVGRVDRGRRPAGLGAGPGRRPRRFAPGLCCSGPGAGPRRRSPFSL